MSLATPAPHARSTRSEWLFYVFGGAPGAVLAFAAWRGLVGERVAIALFAVSFLGLNLAHMAATWTRVYLRAEDWRKDALDRLGVPAALVLAALVLEAIGYGALLLNLQIHLGVYHGLMQNYGVVRMVQRREGRRISAAATRCDQAACVLPAMAALLYRFREINGEYHGVTLFRAPAFLIAAIAAAGLAAVAAYVWREWRAWRAGEVVDGVGPATLLGINALWMSMLLLVPHPQYAIYALSSAHYVQYLYFVWAFESRRDAWPVLPATLRRRVAPPSRAGYLFTLGALGAGVAIALTLMAVGVRAAAAAIGVRAADEHGFPPWIPALIAINLSHFWLDFRVWRLRQPEFKRLLGQEEASALGPPTTAV